MGGIRNCRPIRNVLLNSNMQIGRTSFVVGLRMVGGLCGFKKTVFEPGFQAQHCTGLPAKGLIDRHGRSCLQPIRLANNSYCVLYTMNRHSVKRLARHFLTLIGRKEIMAVVTRYR